MILSKLQSSFGNASEKASKVIKRQPFGCSKL